MNLNHLTKEEARRFLRRHALSEVEKVTDFSKFHSGVFCMLAQYGLLMKAKEEEFLSGDEWHNPSNRESLTKKVEEFLTKHIY